MSKITPFLWFESQAEEAMKHYMKIFTNSKVLNVNRANGQVLSVTFDLDGQEFIALNAGPGFKFTEAVSFFVNCESQAEVDDLWARLSEGGQEAPVRHRPPQRPDVDRYASFVPAAVS
jgi:predicted 3-demethylubiquinone-9 3-methyltransferase (glyoxalase superfamily)